MTREEEIFNDKKKMFELVCSHWMCDVIKPWTTKDQEKEICCQCIKKELEKENK